MITEGDGAYVKDSVWVYSNENFDTLKLEYYKDGLLVSTVKK